MVKKFHTVVPFCFSIFFITCFTTSITKSALLSPSFWAPNQDTAILPRRIGRGGRSTLSSGGSNKLSPKSIRSSLRISSKSLSDGEDSANSALFQSILKALEQTVTSDESTDRRESKEELKRDDIIENRSVVDNKVEEISDSPIITVPAPVHLVRNLNATNKTLIPHLKQRSSNSLQQEEEEDEGKNLMQKEIEPRFQFIKENSSPSVLAIDNNDSYEIEGKRFEQQSPVMNLLGSPSGGDVTRRGGGGTSIQQLFRQALQDEENNESDSAIDDNSSVDIITNDVDTGVVNDESEIIGEDIIDDSISVRHDDGDHGDGDDDIRCIPKVMQVEETVYDRAVKCHHSVQEKCHMSYITDYRSTSQQKCETTFKKNCHITFKPVAINETVSLCHTPLVRECGLGDSGPEVCSTQYETYCQTSYDKYEIEEDEPVCTTEIMQKCQNITLPIFPGDEELVQNHLNGVNNDNQEGRTQSTLGVTIKQQCEDWPVKRCTLTKKNVSRLNPNTSCRKIPRQVCLPQDCDIVPGDEICQDDVRTQIQNVPEEDCELQPEETCHMESVLVPRLIPKPNCIQIPKEICVNTKTNPRRVKKPIIKEWCYRPSDYSEVDPSVVNSRRRAARSERKSRVLDEDRYYSPRKSLSNIFSNFLTGTGLNERWK